ncbi:MAG: hypothetical protein AB7L92_01890 [Alphaproteobacteria bacterium]
MRRAFQQKPKKIRAVLLFLLLIVVTGITLLALDVKPEQQTVEIKLDAAPFLTQNQ